MTEVVVEQLRLRRGGPRETKPKKKVYAGSLCSNCVYYSISSYSGRPICGSPAFRDDPWQQLKLRRCKGFKEKR